MAVNRVEQHTIHTCIGLPPSKLAVLVFVFSWIISLSNGRMHKTEDYENIKPQPVIICFNNYKT